MLQGTEIISFRSLLTTCISIQQKPNWCTFESHDTTLSLNPRKMQGFWDGKETRDHHALTVTWVSETLHLSEGLIFACQKSHHRKNKNQQWHRKGAL